MKFNKMKLAALAMSALMAASTVSPAVYAADLFSDGTAETFISEEPETVDVEESVPVVENVSPAETAPFLEAAEKYESSLPNGGNNGDYDDNGSPKKAITSKKEGSLHIVKMWVYDKNNPKSSQIYYTYRGSDTVYVDTVSDVEVGAAASCTAPQFVTFRHIFDGDNDSVEEQAVVEESLGHDFKETNDPSGVYIEPVVHGQLGKVYYLEKCSRCGIVQADKDRYTNDNEYVEVGPVQHVWTSTVIAAEATAKSNIVVDESKPVAKEVFDGTAGKEKLYEAKLENGIPVVKDPSIKAYYYEVTICKDYSSDHGAEKGQVQTIVPTKSENFEIDYNRSENIAGKSYQEQEDEIRAALQRNKTIDGNKVRLKDCTRDGVLVINYLDGNGDITGSDRISIKAHHWEKKVFRFKSSEDAKNCTVTDKVVNNTCLPITYYEITYCDAYVDQAVQADGKCDYAKKQITYYTNTLGNKEGSYQTKELRAISETEKIAEGSDHHLSEPGIKLQIERYLNTVPSNQLPTYDKLKDLLKTAKYTAIPEDLLTATCTEKGTLTVQYDCMICGKKAIDTQVINIDKLGHDFSMGYLRENIVDPTCTTEGSYDSVLSCKRCGYVKDKKHYTHEKLQHTNSIETDITKKKLTVKFEGNVVVDNANGSLLTQKDKVVKGDETKSGSGDYVIGTVNPAYYVNPGLYSICDNCGWAKAETADEKIIITDIKKEGKSCQPGSITLTVTYSSNDKVLTSGEGTFDYYSSIIAYTGRTAHTMEIVKEETVKNPTDTEKGLKRVTSRCKVCGYEETKDIELPALGVKPATPTVTAKAVDYNSISVSWNAVKDADSYELWYKSADMSITRWKLFRIVKGTTTSFTHTGLTTGARYRYTVKAVVGDTKSDYSKTGAVARPLPAAPEMKSVTAVSNGIKVTWSKVDGADGYIIFRKTPTGTFTRVGSVSKGSKVTWTDKKAVSGSTYKVRAYRTVDNKNYKGAFSAAM